jgi:hypothetical protein
MASEILRPDGAGDETNFPTIVGAATEWECIDEAVADDSTTYVGANATPMVFSSYALQATALGGGDAVDSVDAFARIRGPAAGAGTDDDYSLGVRLRGSNTMSAETQLTDSYADYTNTDVARPGGGSYSVSDLNSLQLRVGLEENGPGQVRFTQGYVINNYTPAVAAGGGRQVIGRGIGRGVGRGAR